MRTTWVHTLTVWGVLCIGLSNRSSGQCVPSRQLFNNLQDLCAQVDVGAQESALEIWQQQWERCHYPLDSTYINGLLQLGLARLYNGKYVEATPVVQKAVQLSQTHRANVGSDQISKSLYRLGVLYNLQNRQHEAYEVLNRAIKLGQSIRLAAKWVGNAHLYLANTYNLAGDYQQALSHAESGEIMAVRLTDKILLAKLLQEKAKAYHKLEQYPQAWQTAERTVFIAQRDESLKAILTTGYWLLGAIAEKQQKTDKALYYQQKAFLTARENKDSYAPNYAVQLGLYYYRLGRYDEAIPYFEFGVANNIDLFDKANALSNLGALYWKKKEFSRALAYYQKGLVTMPIGFREIRIESLPKAQAIRQAAQKEYLLTLIQDKADTWLDYAKATNNKRRFRNALDTYAVADQMIDFMRWEHTGQQSKLYWRQKTRGLYERAIETCYLLGDTEQAFRFLEKSRAVMLADKLNELGARQKLAPQQIEQEQGLRQAVNDQQNKLAGLSPDSANYASIRGTLLTKQDSLDTFLRQLEASNPAYYRYKYDNSTTTLADLQHYLKKRSGSLVTYFVGDSALYVMSVTGDKAVLRKQSIKLYNQTLSQFAGLLASPEAMNKLVNVKRFLMLSHSLYRQLLAPLELPKGRVVISPDGFFVPFDALSRSETQPDYVINDYAFSYAYSASLLMKNNNRPASISHFQTRDFLGIAPVDFSRLGQVTLSGSEVALKPIADRFSSSTMLTHQTATRRAFQTQAPSYRVIHLFTHANADSTDQEPTLYFADSTMRLSDLGDGALPNAELVILAACKTGVGANQRGEGVFSLARGFSALGVPSVLTTLWSVQNQATYQLTSLFYKYLDEGHPKDIALQRAKQEWLTNAEGVNQLPNYWAGLVIVGDTEPLSKANYWLWVVGVLLICLVGLGSWRYLQKRPAKLVSA